MEVQPSYYSKRIHELIIRNVRDSDLGKYECKAENVHGLSSGFVTLTAIPMKPTFEKKNQVATPNSIVISWHATSFAPLLDYRFRFRRVQTGNENFIRGNFSWRPLTIPADMDTTGPFHTKSYRLIGLESSSVYEVVIKARNKYGWSEESNALRFSTPAVSKLRSIKANGIEKMTLSHDIERIFLAM
jgi:neurotrimin